MKMIRSGCICSGSSACSFVSITDTINANYTIKVEEVTALLGDSSKCAFQGILLLFKGIISGQLDADRADYLLRDSIHTGVSYGLYDRNRLINCIDIGQMPETGDLVLAIQNGGWHIAESLVLARYQMFSQVYFHKTRRAYDHHVSYAVKEILAQVYPCFGGFYPTPEYLNEYVQLDDWTMYGKIKEGFGGKHGTNGKKLRFDLATPQVENAISRIGILYLPQLYRSAYIIDGQHRLYGYADSKHTEDNTVPVVAFVNLDKDKQVELFMEINENQKAVSRFPYYE